MQSAHGLDMMQATAWPFILSISIFVIANTLCIRSAFLLGFVSSREKTLFSLAEKEVSDLRKSGLIAIVLIYVISLLVYVGHKYVVYGFFSYSFVDFLERLFFYLFSEPSEVGTFLMTVSIPPAVISMFNFIMSAALLGQYGKVAPDTPSPIIGFFGAFLALVTLLGSLASIWMWALSDVSA